MILHSSSVSTTMTHAPAARSPIDQIARRPESAEPLVVTAILRRYANDFERASFTHAWSDLPGQSVWASGHSRWVYTRRIGIRCFAITART